MTTAHYDSLLPVISTDTLPDDIDVLKAALLAERSARLESEARAAGAEAMVAHLKLLIAKLKHDRFGASSERGRKLLDQLEMQLEDLETTAGEAEAVAEQDPTALARPATRGKPVRGPLPAHLPRERVVLPSPSACPCCGGKLSKLGESVTETLEIVPRRWKVIQMVREKWSCRSCEAITQPPAPFHPIARGRAGPELLATVLEAKFGQHLPLNRQSETFAREGIDLDVSTLADWVGACSAALAPLIALLRQHVLQAGRLHGDDTTVPVLAKGKTVTGRLWTYVRDDRPFGGPAPPAALFFYSPDRTAAHPHRHLAGWRGILQADAYAGFGGLYDAHRHPGPVIEAGCWAHGRRKFFELAQVSKAPLAVEAVRRIDAIFAEESAINGLPAAQRLAERQTTIAPLVTALEVWMQTERLKLSRHAEARKAMDHMLKRWDSFAVDPRCGSTLTDGRICLSNNAAERSLRGVALGWKARLFAGSDRGGERAAAMYSLIVTARLNDVDPRTWLANVLQRIADIPAKDLQELLPWEWKKANAAEKAAA
jgi:transposase